MPCSPTHATISATAVFLQSRFFQVPSDAQLFEAAKLIAGGAKRVLVVTIIEDGELTTRVKEHEPAEEFDKVPAHATEAAKVIGTGALRPGALVHEGARAYEAPALPAAHLCEHANEAPMTCPCPTGCYCKTRTCAPRKETVMRAEAWPFPWPEPTGPDSHYQTNGPVNGAVFTVEGHEFSVQPTDKDGMHTARMRFNVKCHTCGADLHHATTSPPSIIRGHLRSVRAR